MHTRHENPRPRPAPRHPRRRRHGAAIAYIAVMAVILVAFCSLAVDLARVQVAKTELRRLTDAAALYGATQAPTSSALAVTAARTAAADNAIDVLASFSLPAANVVTGSWSSSTGFTSGGASLNAVRVTASYDVPLIFAQVVGQSTCRVRSTSTGYGVINPPFGFMGLTGITTKNNTFAASYNSSLNTSPSQAGASSNGLFGSNAVIDGKNNGTLYGTALIGQNGSVTGLTVNGSTTKLTGVLTPPTMPSYVAGSNPNGLGHTGTFNSDTTLPGGTYWFDTLTINANLSFSGAATVYVNGDVTIGGTLTAYNTKPANLRIYQIGAHSFGDASSNGMDIVADIWAPSSDFSVKNNLKIRGRAYFNNIFSKNNAEFYYDEAFGPATGGPVSSLVQ